MAEQSAHSTADVATDRPARYGKQLTSHMSRKSTTSWDPDNSTGTIEFTGGTADFTCTDSALHIELTAAADNIDQLEDVVGRHLVRFGARDELVVQWVRADGSAGTRQENTG